jgi:hypothetical protein
LPTEKQSFYMPNVNYYQKLLAPDSNPKISTLGHIPFGSTTPFPSGSTTPLPNDLERETLFTGIWSPGWDAKHPLSSPIPSLSPLLPAGSQMPIPSTLASPSVPSDIQTSLTPPRLTPMSQHWILHPNLIDIPIQVDIVGGELDTSKRKGGVFVKTKSGEDGLSVVCQRSSNRTVVVPCDSVTSFHL